MRYAKLSCIELYSCYLHQCLATDLFTYRTPDHSQKGHVNRVCRSFCSEVFLELALQFFLELSVVLGTRVVLNMAEPDCLKIKFCPQNGENRPSLGFFECIGKFRFFSQFFNFFAIWSIMKVYITVIVVCLNKCHIWENSGSLDMTKNVLGQSDWTRP